MHTYRYVCLLPEKQHHMFLMIMNNKAHQTLSNLVNLLVSLHNQDD